ncbi:MAG: hypothetical protein QM737_19705 [Ferruginibacter sp.]
MSTVIFLQIADKAKCQCPDFEAYVGTRSSGSYYRPLFILQDSINVFINYHNLSEKKGSLKYRIINIDSFSILVLRNDSVIFRSKNKGYIFESGLKNIVSKALVGDRVIIYDINAMDYDGTKIQLNPLEYLVDEY